MSLLYFSIGVLVGVFLGVGVSIFYLRWKVGQQLTGMQKQMEDVMDMAAEFEEEDISQDIEKEEK